MTAFLSLRPEPHSDVLEEAPAGWEPHVFDPTLDSDALSWLGFEPAEPEEPLLTWPRPRGWSPVPRRRTGGRHRAPARGA